MKSEYGKVNLLELILRSMKNGSQYPFELNYLAGTLAEIINPMEKRAIAYKEEQVGPTVMADLKEMYNCIHQNKPWRGINPVIAISNPTDSGITDLVLDQHRDDLMRTYPLIGSTLGSINDPFGSKDEIIIIGNYQNEPLMKKLRVALDSRLKINYDIPNGLISRALYDISEQATSGIARFNEQFGKFYYVSRSISEGFKVHTNFYYSQQAVPNEVIKREFTFQCVSDNPKYGGAPFDVRAQIIEGDKNPKIININSNKVVGFSRKTWVMNQLFNPNADAEFVKNFSASIEEARTKGFSVAHLGENNKRTLNFAEVDGDVIVEDTENGEVTKVSDNPNKENDLQVEAIKTESDTDIPADNIVDNNAGTNMAPASDQKTDEGQTDSRTIVHDQHQESTEGTKGKTFSEVSEGEGADNVNAPEGGAAAPTQAAQPEVVTKGGAAAPVDVILEEGQPDKTYSITFANGAHQMFSGTFREAFLFASKFGTVRVFSETDIPADQIKENLDGSQMAPASKENIQEGVVDPNKAGMVNDQFGGSKEGTQQFSEDEVKDLVEKCNEVENKVDEIKDKVKEGKEQEAKDLAQETKTLTKELEDKVEKAESAGHVVDDVKSECARFSYICSCVLANRTFSDEECPVEDIKKDVEKLETKVEDLKESKDIEAAKEVAKEAEKIEEKAEKVEDELKEEVQTKCRKFSYIAHCILANKTFSEDEETKTEEEKKAEEEAAAAQTEEETKNESALNNLLFSNSPAAGDPAAQEALMQGQAPQVPAQPAPQAPAVAPAAPAAPADVTPVVDPTSQPTDQKTFSTTGAAVGLKDDYLFSQFG
jgi:hypothetical protein